MYSIFMEIWQLDVEIPCRRVKFYSREIFNLMVTLEGKDPSSGDNDYNSNLMEFDL